MQMKLIKKFFFIFLIIYENSLYAEKLLPSLTIYTYSSFFNAWGPGLVIKKNFELKYNCKVKFIAMESSISMLNKLRIEGTHSQADIILGLDNNVIEIAEKTNLFDTLNLENTFNIPIAWSNKKFIPYDYSYLTFIYNKNKINFFPKSFKEFIESKEYWNIIYQDPRTSSLGLTFLLWIQKIYGSSASDVWKKIEKKTITITKNWSQSYSLFLKGEADVVVGYNTSLLHLLQSKYKNKYDVANFSEGHYLHIEVIGKLKNSQQPELAKKFIKFILTKSCQEHITKKNWMYPVVDIILPNHFKNLKIPNIKLIYTPNQVYNKRVNWIKIWKNAIN